MQHLLAALIAAENGNVDWQAYNVYNFIYIATEAGRDIDTARVSDVCNLSQRQARRIVDRLCEANLIQRERSGRAQLLRPIKHFQPSKRQTPVPASNTTSTEARKKVKAPGLWADVFARYRRSEATTATVRESLAPRLKTFLRENEPSMLTRSALETILSKDYPLAYLAALIDDSGNVDPSLRQESSRSVRDPAMVRIPVDADAKKEAAAIFDKPLFEMEKKDEATHKSKDRES